jgi:hypothetical protein
MPIVSRSEPLGRVARLWAADADDDPSEAARRLIRGVVMGQFAVVSLLGKDWWFVAKDTLQKIGKTLPEPRWRMSLEEAAKAIAAQWSRFELDQHGMVCAVRSGSPFARAPMEGELPDRAAILSEVTLTEMVNEVLRMKVSRDEFLRWVDEQGCPRPAFWDGSGSVPAKVPRAGGKKNPPGRVPIQTPKAIAKLRAAVAADPSLRTRPLKQKELRELCGGVSWDTARKTRNEVLGE